MSLLTLIVQAVRAKLGRKRAAGPPPFSSVVKANLRQVSRWSLPFYVAVAAIFLQVTQLFRGVERLPEFAALHLSPPRQSAQGLCHEEASREWATLCRTPASDPFPNHHGSPQPDCLLTHVAAKSEGLDRVFVWSDGFALTCSQKAGVDFTEKASQALQRLQSSPPPRRVTVIYSGIPHDLMQALRTSFSQQAEVDVVLQAVGGNKAFADRLCDSGFHSYLGSNPLPVTGDGVIAARLRQTLDSLVLADSVHDNASPGSDVTLLLLKTTSSLACIPQGREMLSMGGSGTLLILRDEEFLREKLVAALRKTVNLSSHTICDELDLSARCQFEGEALQRWERRERNRSRQIHESLHNLDALKRIQMIELVLHRHEATDTYLSLQQEIVHLLNLKNQTGLTEEERTLLSSNLHQLDTGSYLERRMYLSPSFVVALYGPVTVLFVLPLTTLIRKLLRKDTRGELLSMWR